MSLQREKGKRFPVKKKRESLVSILSKEFICIIECFPLSRVQIGSNSSLCNACFLIFALVEFVRASLSLFFKFLHDKKKKKERKKKEMVNSRWQIIKTKDFHTSMSSLCFHPTSAERRERTVVFLPALIRNTFKAAGTTIFFFLSYGGGHPSKTFIKREK